jgi:hypothetical protein
MSDRTKKNKKEGGKLIMLHSMHSLERKSDDSVVEREEIIRDGSRGISFKLFLRDDSKKIKHKYLGFGNADGTFSLIFTINGEKVEMKNISASDMMDKIKAVKDLKFVVEYLKSLKGRKLGRLNAAGPNCCPRGPNCNHRDCKYNMLSRLSGSRSRSRSRSTSRKSRSRKSRKTSKK